MEIIEIVSFHLNNFEQVLEVSFRTNNDTEDLMEDFVSIITSFCARIYGKRRSKRNTEKLIQELSTND